MDVIVVCPVAEVLRCCSQQDWPAHVVRACRHQRFHVRGHQSRWRGRADNGVVGDPPGVKGATSRMITSPVGAEHVDRVASADHADSYRPPTRHGEHRLEHAVVDRSGGNVRMSGRRQSDARAVQYMSRRGGGTRGGGSGMTRENCGHAPPPTEESEAHVEGVSASHDPARSTGEASANDQHACSTGEKATVLRVDDLDPMVRNVTEVLDASGRCELDRRFELARTRSPAGGARQRREGCAVSGRGRPGRGWTGVRSTLVPTRTSARGGCEREHQGGSPREAGRPTHTASVRPCPQLRSGSAPSFRGHGRRRAHA